MTPLPPELARETELMRRFHSRRFHSRRGHVTDPVTGAHIPVEGLAERTPLYDGVTSLPAGSFNGVEFLGAEDQGNRHLTRRANKLLRRALKRRAKPVFDDEGESR